MVWLVKCLYHDKFRITPKTVNTSKRANGAKETRINFLPTLCFNEIAAIRYGNNKTRPATELEIRTPKPYGLYSSSSSKTPISPSREKKSGKIATNGQTATKDFSINEVICTLNASRRGAAL